MDVFFELHCLNIRGIDSTSEKSLDTLSQTFLQYIHSMVVWTLAAAIPGQIKTKRDCAGARMQR